MRGIARQWFHTLQSVKSASIGNAPEISRAHHDATRGFTPLAPGKSVVKTLRRAGAVETG
jgi:hypothetical protein